MSRSRSLRSWSALLVAGALAVAACGGDDDDAVTEESDAAVETTSGAPAAPDTADDAAAERPRRRPTRATTADRRDRPGRRRAPTSGRHRDDVPAARGRARPRRVVHLRLPDHGQPPGSAPRLDQPGRHDAVPGVRPARAPLADGRADPRPGRVVGVQRRRPDAHAARATRRHVPRRRRARRRGRQGQPRPRQEHRGLVGGHRPGGDGVRDGRRPDDRGGQAVDAERGHHRLVRRSRRHPRQPAGASPTASTSTPTWSGPGPYKMVSHVHGDSTKYERNDDYWDQEHLAPVKNLEIKVIADNVARLNAIRTGRDQRHHDQRRPDPRGRGQRRTCG